MRRNFNIFQRLYSSNKLPLDCVCVLLDYCFEYAKSKNLSHSHKLDDKFDLLFTNSPWKKFSNSDFVVNLSAYNLTRFEQIILGFGLSFGFRERFDPLPDFIINYNKFLRYTNLDIFKEENFASTLKGFILSEIMNTKKDLIPKVLLDAVFKLKKQDDIIITRADKGNKIVILDRDTYINKAEILLNDRTVYKKLSSNPLKSAQNFFNRELKLILRDNPDLIKRFHSYLPKLSYFYGLPKIHKLHMPLRPIISNIDCISYNLSKWISKTLSSFVGDISNSHIKNSSDFVDKIRHLDLNNKIMVSFDVVSLFTKVPVELTLTWLKVHLENNLMSLPINIDNFFKLIKLCLECSHFTFNGDFYTQISGLCMGSPLSPILSNLFMELFEIRFLPLILPADYTWIRYVDDIFAVLPSEFDLDSALVKLNDCVQGIDFTIERENNGELPFLDVMLTRNPGSGLSFKIFRKNTHVDSYVHWFSRHSIKQKRGILSGFFNRAYKICSPQFLDQEIDYIRRIFVDLAYPPSLIDNTLKNCKKKYYSKRPKSNFDSKNILALPIDSSRIQSILKPEICVISSSSNNLGCFLKNNLNNTEKIGGVYRIPCLDCSRQYFGETCDFKRRIYQHNYALKIGDYNSSLHTHRMQFDHRISTKDASIVMKSDSQDRRSFYEALCINNINCFNTNKNTSIDIFTNKILLNSSKLSTFIKNLNNVT